MTNTTRSLRSQGPAKRKQQEIVENTVGPSEQRPSKRREASAATTSPSQHNGPANPAAANPSGAKKKSHHKNKEGGPRSTTATQRPRERRQYVLKEDSGELGETDANESATTGEDSDFVVLNEQGRYAQQQPQQSEASSSSSGSDVELEQEQDADAVAGASHKRGQRVAHVSRGHAKRPRKPGDAQHRNITQSGARARRRTQPARKLRRTAGLAAGSAACAADGEEASSASPDSEEDAPATTPEEACVLARNTAKSRNEKPGHKQASVAAHKHEHRKVQKSMAIMQALYPLRFPLSEASQVGQYMRAIYATPFTGRQQFVPGQVYKYQVFGTGQGAVGLCYPVGLMQRIKATMHLQYPYGPACLAMLELGGYLWRGCLPSAVLAGGDPRFSIFSPVTAATLNPHDAARAVDLALLAIRGPGGTLLNREDEWAGAVADTHRGRALRAVAAVDRAGASMGKRRLGIDAGMIAAVGGNGMPTEGGPSGPRGPLRGHDLHSFLAALFNGALAGSPWREGPRLGCGHCPACRDVWAWRRPCMRALPLRNAHQMDLLCQLLNVDITFNPPQPSAGGRNAILPGIATPSSLNRALLGHPAVVAPMGGPLRTTRLAAGVRMPASDMHVIVDPSQQQALAALHRQRDAGEGYAPLRPSNTSPVCSWCYGPHARMVCPLLRLILPHAQASRQYIEPPNVLDAKRRLSYKRHLPERKAALRAAAALHVAHTTPSAQAGWKGSSRGAGGGGGLCSGLRGRAERVGGDVLGRADEDAAQMSAGDLHGSVPMHAGSCSASGSGLQARLGLHANTALSPGLASDVPPSPSASMAALADAQSLHVQRYLAWQQLPHALQEWMLGMQLPGWALSLPPPTLRLMAALSAAEPSARGHAPVLMLRCTIEKEQRRLKRGLAIERVPDSSESDPGEQEDKQQQGRQHRSRQDGDAARDDAAVVEEEGGRGDDWVDPAGAGAAAGGGRRAAPKPGRRVMFSGNRSKHYGQLKAAHRSAEAAVERIFGPSSQHVITASAAPMTSIRAVERDANAWTQKGARPGRVSGAGADSPAATAEAGGEEEEGPVRKQGRLCVGGVAGFGDTLSAAQAGLLDGGPPRKAEREVLLFPMEDSALHWGQPDPLPPDMLLALALLTEELALEACDSRPCNTCAVAARHASDTRVASVRQAEAAQHTSNALMLAAQGECDVATQATGVLEATAGLSAHGAAAAAVVATAGAAAAAQPGSQRPGRGPASRDPRAAPGISLSGMAAPHAVAGLHAEMHGACLPGKVHGHAPGHMGVQGHSAAAAAYLQHALGALQSGSVAQAALLETPL